MKSREHNNHNLYEFRFDHGVIKFISDGSIMEEREMAEDFDVCSICKIGHLRLTGEVVMEGESAGEFTDIGTRRVFICENASCKQRQVRVGVREYLNIGSNVKTKRKDDPG